VKNKVGPLKVCLERKLLFVPIKVLT